MPGYGTGDGNCRPLRAKHPDSSNAAQGCGRHTAVGCPPSAERSSRSRLHFVLRQNNGMVMIKREYFMLWCMGWHACDETHGDTNSSCFMDTHTS